MYNQIFGPVPSRRLGLSLGVDLVPFKTCSLNCIYCECGATTDLTIERKCFFPYEQIINCLKNKISKTDKIDFITFSGSGEPTLSLDIGKIINWIKSNSKIPVAVLTNGTLLYLPEVRNDLLNADLVMPSLDAVSNNIFSQINRPEKNLQINKIIDGLIKFRDEYKGKIYLEILFVKGINDDPDELKKIVAIAEKIKPNLIQLNTCVRPGTESDITILSKQELENIASKFSVPVEIISTFNKKSSNLFANDDIISLISRRPCSLDELSSLTSQPVVEILKKIENIQSNDYKIKIDIINNKKFYSILNVK
jgi:wyosine [tRNA(Phe)-imidazoG37] synthetase (radical SAM superfamily)